MSTSIAVTEAAEHHSASPRPKEPFKSPSYPPRVHFGERAQLEERLRACDRRIQAIRGELDASGNASGRAGLERIYFQMLGARDQIAEAARRLPLETGALYDEDKERYEEAVAAFERLDRHWRGLER